MFAIAPLWTLFRIEKVVQGNFVGHGMEESMGLFTKLFGGKEESALDPLKDSFALIRKILDDEQYQIQILPEVVRDLIVQGDSFDVDPFGTGPFGFVETNPIPVNGPLGELAYLSRLETLSGQRVLFHRLGSMKVGRKAGAANTIDVFEAVTFDGADWFIFYLDFYHPRRSRTYPDGFRETSQVPKFCGFNKLATNFPYDFAEMKSGESNSGLSFAYIALGKVLPQINAREFNRPPTHVKALINARKKLGFLS